MGVPANALLKKPSLKTRANENELCSWIFFFLSLLWVRKVSFWTLEFCLMYLFSFRFPEISRRAQAHFPQWESLWARWGSASWPLPALDSFPWTSHCFHDTDRERSTKAMSRITATLCWKTREPESSYPEETPSALKITRQKTTKFCKAIILQ